VIFQQDIAKRTVIKKVHLREILMMKGLAYHGFHKKLLTHPINGAVDRVSDLQCALDHAHM